MADGWNAVHAHRLTCIKRRAATRPILIAGAWHNGLAPARTMLNEARAPHGGGGRLLGEDTAMFGSLRLQGQLVLAFGVLLACMPVSAQQSASVEGITVNFGAIPAEVALTAAGHRESHPTHPPAGSQHLLITLDDQKSGRRIGDAEVAVEVIAPGGRVEKKPLLHTQAGGFADYSELFVFGSSGKYTVRVLITPAQSARPVETKFIVNHVV